MDFPLGSGGSLKVAHIHWSEKLTLFKQLNMSAAIHVLWNSQHLKQTHPELSAAERQSMLKMAKVCRIQPQRASLNLDWSKGQIQLGEYSRGKPEVVGPYKEAIQRQQGTRSFPLSQLGKNTVLDNFNTWLRGIEGKSRDAKTAQEITTDVSKFLRWVHWIA